MTFVVVITMVVIIIRTIGIEIGDHHPCKLIHALQPLPMLIGACLVALRGIMIMVHRQYRLIHDLRQ